MKNVLAFVALGAFLCQCSARIDIASPIESSVIKLLVDCNSIKHDRHHKKIDPKKLQFYLYDTRVNKTTFFNLKDAAKIFKNIYNTQIKDPIHLFIPGFNAGHQSPNVAIVKDGLTKLKNINFIILDHSFYLQHEDGTQAENYLKAVTNVYGVGELLGEVLAQFIKDGVPLEKIHLIAHSLGAHLAGYATQRVYDIVRKKMKRISGIDPSFPCFNGMEIADQLSSDDADYVDIYHSNMGVSGTTHSLGTANFFINGGGPLQPSCPGIPYLAQECSHVYNSLNFFVESALHPDKFIAQKCDSYEHLKEGKCKTWPTAKAGFFSEPTKGDYYIQFEFSYFSHLIDLLSTSIAKFWENLTSLFG